MLRKHFPDWKDRMDYQKKQEKFYKSAMLRKQEIQRLRRIETPNLYTKEELDAISYYQGTGFYSYYQSLETPPNIFDTRWSFLLKVEKNKKMRHTFLKRYNQNQRNMRETFLKSYNQSESEN